MRSKVNRMYSVTIGIPYYNRPKLIRRCLNSLEQANRAGRLKVIIFDDGSPVPLQLIDRLSFEVQIIRSDLNVGVCEGRRTLLSACETDLFMILDSDDTIPSNYFDLIDRHFESDLDGVLFQCRWDDGSISPAIPFPGDILTLNALLGFIEKNPTRRLEWRSVVKTATRSEVTWPPGHRKMERYHLDLVRKYRVKGVNAVIRNYHSDADDQISKIGLHGDQSPKVTRDRVLGVIELLQEYGVELKSLSPKRYIHQMCFLFNHLKILKTLDISEYTRISKSYPNYFSYKTSLLMFLIFNLNKVRRKSRWLWPI
jgi:glycosyltransferase involved in cell wall biosynthesis